MLLEFSLLFSLSVVSADADFQRAFIEPLLKFTADPLEGESLGDLEFELFDWETSILCPEKLAKFDKIDLFPGKSPYTVFGRFEILKELVIEYKARLNLQYKAQFLSEVLKSPYVDPHGSYLAFVHLSLLVGELQLSLKLQLFCEEPIWDLITNVCENIYYIPIEVKELIGSVPKSPIIQEAEKLFTWSFHPLRSENIRELRSFVKMMTELRYRLPIYREVSMPQAPLSERELDVIIREVFEYLQSLEIAQTMLLDVIKYLKHENISTPFIQPLHTETEVVRNSLLQVSNQLKRLKEKAEISRLTAETQNLLLPSVVSSLSTQTLRARIRSIRNLVPHPTGQLSENLRQLDEYAAATDQLKLITIQQLTAAMTVAPNPNLSQLSTTLEALKRVEVDLGRLGAEEDVVNLNQRKILMEVDLQTRTNLLSNQQRELENLGAVLVTSSCVEHLEAARAAVSQCRDSEIGSLVHDIEQRILVCERRNAFLSNIQKLDVQLETAWANFATSPLENLRLNATAFLEAGGHLRDCLQVPSDMTADLARIEQNISGRIESFRSRVQQRFDSFEATTDLISQTRADLEVSLQSPDITNLKQLVDSAIEQLQVLKSVASSENSWQKHSLKDDLVLISENVAKLVRRLDHEVIFPILIQLHVLIARADSVSTDELETDLIRAVAKIDAHSISEVQRIQEVVTAAKSALEQAKKLKKRRRVLVGLSVGVGLFSVVALYFLWKTYSCVSQSSSQSNP